MVSNKRPVVKSADRVLDVFELLAGKRRPLTHAALAAELGIPKSSLSQLVANLVARGYIVYTPGPNTYALGPSLGKLVRRHRHDASLTELAQPLTERLTRLTGESSSLNLRRDDFVQRVCGANSTQPLTFSMTVGDEAPMHAVSSGKILLAELDDAALDAYVARARFARITPQTLSSAAALRRELAKVRQEGLAWAQEEYTSGIIGVAVAVRDAEGHAVGALNVAFPSARDTPAHRQRIAGALHDAAASLARDLSAEGN